jgi:nicotinate-nucleotide adenylyltransferase
MKARARIGLLGGTLDPVHVGHVETAQAARLALNLDLVIVLPSRVPPHRAQQPYASAWHRFAMAALAVNGVDGLAASDLELTAPGPSYTADTLTRVVDSAGLDASQIFFITGADAFAEIETWHRYPEVLRLANFVVVSRPGYPAAALRQRLPALVPAMRSAEHRDTPLDTQGSRTAEPLQFPAIYLVEASTPDVSSTDIRRRLASGASITGFVPETVERHIIQHSLYTDRSGRALFTAEQLHGQN